jgi:hypothetical protein
MKKLLMFLFFYKWDLLHKKQNGNFRNGIDAKTQRPLAYVVVSVQTRMMQLTASNGLILTT